VRRTLAVVLLLAAGTGHASDGEYLFGAAGCLACHTAEDGPALAGGRALKTAFGVFYSPNITPDRETGIGGWTRAQFVSALKHGTAPDGSAYFPAFPYTSYRQMSDADAGLIFDYLQTTTPVRQANRRHDLPWWLARWMIKLWQWWVLEAPEPAPPSVRDDPLLSRGRYLVEALGHCGECHTPRNWLGVSIRSRLLAGTLEGPEGDKVPNITPNRDSGIGRWDADELAWFLESGELPDGDYTGGLMTEVVDNATARLTVADRAAMVAYLRSLTPLPGP
jgi:mono/diheme cytochrome c family protein